MATAGLVLAVLFWPIGLILSIIGLRHASRHGGQGRLPAITGLLLSPIFALISIAIITTVAYSTTEKDPGCVAAKPYLATLNTDFTQEGSSDDAPTTFLASVNSSLRNMPTISNGLHQAATAANRQDVKDAITAVNFDIQACIATNGIDPSRYDDLSRDTDTLNHYCGVPTTP
jgi:hypothetical protein